MEEIAKVYSAIIHAGVYKATSIKVAEAAKVIENSQRDLNISFMNDLAIIFDRMGIDTSEVLEAAGTKWNFLKFQPGLVGNVLVGITGVFCFLLLKVILKKTPVIQIVEYFIHIVSLPFCS